MKKIKTLGIITTIFLVLLISVFGILAAFGFFGSEKPESGEIITEIIPETEKSGLEIPKTGIIAVIKTDAGDFETVLSETSASEKFIELAKNGVFEGAEFKTLAENMFIQASVYGENFSAEKTGFACVNNAVAFVLDEESVSPSFFVITNKKLSGFSKAYMTEKGFEEEKIGFYEKNGGIPEYEGKVLVFGKIVSGFETVEKIASAEKSGYTGGYSALEPVKIISVEISYPEETN